MFVRLALASTALMCLSACVVVDHEERIITKTSSVEYDLGPEGRGLGLPFSKSVRVDDLIFLSGELGIAPGTRTPVEGGAGPETTQIFKNIETTLARHGASLSDIVKCTVFLEDMADYGEMNAAYKAALPDPKPARSTFGVDGIALGASLEIECIAVKPD